MQRLKKQGLLYFVLIFIVYKTFQGVSEQIQEYIRYKSTIHQNKMFQKEGEFSDLNSLINDGYRIKQPLYEYDMTFNYALWVVCFVLMAVIYYKIRLAVKKDRKIENESHAESFVYTLCCAQCSMCQVANEYSETFFDCNRRDGAGEGENVEIV